MRMMLKGLLDTEYANERFSSGGATGAIDRMIERLHPEALYTFVEDGQRAFIAIFDLADPAQLPVVTEPMFRRKVKVTLLTPCLNVEDTKKGAEEAFAQMQAMQGQPTQ